MVSVVVSKNNEVFMSKCLSEEVAALERKVETLERAVAQTKYVVGNFVGNYDSIDYKSKMPLNRKVHTAELRRLLVFIDGA